MLGIEVYKAPYWMAPAELKELKLQELMDKGFNRPN